MLIKIQRFFLRCEMDTFRQNKNSVKAPITKKQASDSGMALVLIALICFAVFRHNAVPWHDAWLWAAVAILVIDMISPIIFKPFAFVWFGFSRILGTFMSKIMLALVFFLVVFPMGLIRRILGKDTLRLRQFRKEKTSVFAERNHEYTAADLDNPSLLKEGKMELLADLWDYLKVRKKFWLLPSIMVLLLIGLLIVLSSSSAIAPFIYTIF